MPHFLYPFLCWWTFRLLPHLGCCEYCCSEHRSADISLRSWCQFWINTQEEDCGIICPDGHPLKCWMGNCHGPQEAFKPVTRRDGHWPESWHGRSICARGQDFFQPWDAVHRVPQCEVWWLRNVCLQLFLWKREGRGGEGWRKEEGEGKKRKKKKENYFLFTPKEKTFGSRKGGG